MANWKTYPPCFGCEDRGENECLRYATPSLCKMYYKFARPDSAYQKSLKKKGRKIAVAQSCDSARKEQEGSGRRGATVPPHAISSSADHGTPADAHSSSLAVEGIRAGHGGAAPASPNKGKAGGGLVCAVCGRKITLLTERARVGGRDLCGRCAERRFRMVNRRNINAADSGDSYRIP